MIHLRVKDQLTFLEYKNIITLIQLKKEKKKKRIGSWKKKANALSDPLYKYSHCKVTFSQAKK